MYKEIAIDPHCMAYFEYYVLLKREFGFNKGRYAATDIKEWAKEAFQNAKNSKMPPVKKKSVTSFLNRVQRGKDSDGFLLTIDRKQAKANSWNEWWINQSQLRKFDATVSVANIEGSINIEQIMEGSSDWEIPSSISVDKTADEIINAIEPLLKLSTKVLLVDQYFRLSGNESLTRLVEKVNETSISRLTIITSMETRDIKRLFEVEIRPLIKEGLAFEWIKVPGKAFHDRYLISDIGALRVGQGFMVDTKKGAHADLLNINLVSKDEANTVHQSLKQMLADGTAISELSVNGD